MIVLPIRGRDGKPVAAYDGILCQFDHGAPLPAIRAPIQVMICLAASPRYAPGYAAMSEDAQAENPPWVPYLVVREVTADDVLVAVTGFARSAPHHRPRAVITEASREELHARFGVAPRFLSAGRSPVVEVSPIVMDCHCGHVYVAAADLRNGLARVSGLPDLSAVDPMVVAHLTRRPDGHAVHPHPRRTVDTLTSRRGQRSA